MFTLSGVYSSLSFRCKCQILSGGCGLLGYITGTEEIVMKQAETYINHEGTLEECTASAVEKVNLYQQE
mgnify:CR=1 FL=1